MKRFVAMIGAVLSVVLLARSINDLRDADTWIEVFKSLFWYGISFLAFFGFREDYINDEWPWI